ncbi:MAG: NTP transferase domain-containing protein [Proteobacteria bacterium]|nr:NTP transferase domain-containing protein [Pseudomonadota bacterium]
MTGDSKPTEAAQVAVILAAGSGSRLYSTTHTPKPLVKVLGLSLAERVICTLSKAVNIRHFIVILGFEAGQVKAHFAEIARRRNVTVEFQEATDWQRGNGVSALAAKGHTGTAPFFLVMSDHLIDTAIPQALVQNPPAAGSVCLAVDHDKAGIFDLDDVTRVQITDNCIKAIDKNLAQWDAGDTGVFLCTSAIFEGLEKAAEKNKFGLSDALRELAQEGRAGTIDVTGRAWLDVDTPQALHEAEQRLLQELGCKLSDGPVARYLNRPLSRWITGYLVHTPATPNLISFVSWLLSCFAAVLFVIGGYPALVLGGLIAQFASVIDGCDGEVARLKHSESQSGGWFDAVLDRYADAFLLFGLTWHVFSANNTHFSLVIGFAAIIGSFMISYTADKYDGLMARRLQGAVYFRLGRDIRVFIIFLAALFNQPLFALIVIAMIMNIEVVRRIFVCMTDETV